MMEFATSLAFMAVVYELSPAVAIACIVVRCLRDMKCRLFGRSGNSEREDEVSANWKVDQPVCA